MISSNSQASATPLHADGLLGDVVNLLLSAGQALVGFLIQTLRLFLLCPFAFPSKRVNLKRKDARQTFKSTTCKWVIRIFLIVFFFLQVGGAVGDPTPEYSEYLTAENQGRVRIQRNIF